MASLIDVLAEASQWGYLGGDSVDAHVEHGRRFLVALPEDSRRVLDLGSGGGIPGLVLALDRPEWDLVLLDRRAQRTDFLRRAVGRLGVGNVEVVTGEASVLARREEHRGRYDAVVARSFGPPAVTAEAAAGFLRLGGVLAVSEPPDLNEDRWPATALDTLGLMPDGANTGGIRRFRAARLCPEKYPRRQLRPPLF